MTNPFATHTHRMSWPRVIEGDALDHDAYIRGRLAYQRGVEMSASAAETSAYRSYLWRLGFSEAMAEALGVICGVTLSPMELP